MKRRTGEGEVLEIKKVPKALQAARARGATPLHATSDEGPRRSSNRVRASADFAATARGGLSAGFVELIKKASDVSSTILDPFDDYASLSITAGVTPLKIYEPYYPFTKLQSLFLSSSVLRQCIEAYATNIDGFGHVLEYIGPEGKEDSQSSLSEKAVLEAFLRRPNPTLSLINTRKHMRVDRHSYGNGVFECQRGSQGHVNFMQHVSMLNMRISEIDPQLVPVSVRVPTSTGKVITVTQQRRFRRFVQQIGGSAGSRYVYFKEFGDPRIINARTGQVDPNTPVQDRATEIKWFYNYTPGMGYGTPLWIATIIDILGNREASNVNLNFFRDNAIPALAVLVGGGFLAEDAINQIRQKFENSKGADATNSVIVLEALADDTGDANKQAGIPRIDLKPLSNERQSDMLFQDYQKQTKNTVRSAMRLPALYTGDTEEYTKATAQTSMLVAENQIFDPERTEFDAWMNDEVFASYGILNWRFKSLAPKLADVNAVTNLLQALDKIGALTPNVGIKLANELLSLSVEKVKQIWGDYPFEMTRDLIRTGTAAAGMEELIGDAFVAPPVKSTPSKDNGGSLPKVHKFVYRTRLKIKPKPRKPSKPAY